MSPAPVVRCECEAADVGEVAATAAVNDEEDEEYGECRAAAE